MSPDELKGMERGAELKHTAMGKQIQLKYGGSLGPWFFYELFAAGQIPPADYCRTRDIPSWKIMCTRQLPFKNDIVVLSDKDQKKFCVFPQSDFKLLETP